MDCFQRFDKLLCYLGNSLWVETLLARYLLKTDTIPRHNIEACQDLCPVPLSKILENQESIVKHLGNTLALFMLVHCRYSFDFVCHHLGIDRKFDDVRGVLYLENHSETANANTRANCMLSVDFKAFHCLETEHIAVKLLVSLSGWCHYLKISN